MIGNNPEAKKTNVSFPEISVYFLGSVGRQFFLRFILHGKSMKVIQNTLKIGMLTFLFLAQPRSCQYQGVKFHLPTRI